MPCRPSDILRQAQERAQAIVQEGVNSAGEVSRVAEGRGFDEGRKRGYEAGVREAQARVDEARRELELAKRQRRAMMHEAEPEVARLAVRIASLVLKREISLHPEAIAGLVRDAVARTTDNDIITVRAAPESAAVLTPLFAGLAGGEGIRNLRFEGDPALQPGDCILETSHGTIDERLPVQLERVAASFEAVDKHG